MPKAAQGAKPLTPADRERLANAAYKRERKAKRMREIAGR